MKYEVNTPKTKASIALMDNTLAKADYLEHGFVYGLAKIFGEVSQQITEEVVRDIFKNGLKDGMITIGTQAMKEMLAEANAKGNVPVDDSLTYDGDSVTFLKEASEPAVPPEHHVQVNATEPKLIVEDRMLDLKELPKEVNMGQSRTRLLPQISGFPFKKDGRKIVVSKTELDAWIAEHPNYKEMASQLLKEKLGKKKG